MKDYKLVIGGRSVSLTQLEQKIMNENQVMKQQFSKIHEVIKKFGFDSQNQENQLQKENVQNHQMINQKLIGNNNGNMGGLNDSLVQSFGNSSSNQTQKEKFRETAEFNNSKLLTLGNLNQVQEFDCFRKTSFQGKQQEGGGCNNGTIGFVQLGGEHFSFRSPFLENQIFPYSQKNQACPKSSEISSPNAKFTALLKQNQYNNATNESTRQSKYFNIRPSDGDQNYETKASKNQSKLNLATSFQEYDNYQDLTTQKSSQIKARYEKMLQELNSEQSQNSIQLQKLISIGDQQLSPASVTTPPFNYISNNSQIHASNTLKQQVNQNKNQQDQSKQQVLSKNQQDFPEQKYPKNSFKQKQSKKSPVCARQSNKLQANSNQSLKEDEQNMKRKLLHIFKEGSPLSIQEQTCVLDIKAIKQEEIVEKNQFSQERKAESSQSLKRRGRLERSLERIKERKFIPVYQSDQSKLEKNQLNGQLQQLQTILQEKEPSQQQQEKQLCSFDQKFNSSFAQQQCFQQSFQSQGISNAQSNNFQTFDQQKQVTKLDENQNIMYCTASEKNNNQNQGFKDNVSIMFDALMKSPGGVVQIKKENINQILKSSARSQKSSVTTKQNSPHKQSIINEINQKSFASKQEERCLQIENKEGKQQLMQLIESHFANDFDNQQEDQFQFSLHKIPSPIQSNIIRSSSKSFFKNKKQSQRKSRRQQCKEIYQLNSEEKQRLLRNNQSPSPPSLNHSPEEVFLRSQNTNDNYKSYCKEGDIKPNSQMKVQEVSKNTGIERGYQDSFINIHQTNNSISNKNNNQSVQTMLEKQDSNVPTTTMFSARFDRDSVSINTPSNQTRELYHQQQQKSINSVANLVTENNGQTGRQVPKQEEELLKQKQKSPSSPFISTLLDSYRRGIDKKYQVIQTRQRQHDHVQKKQQLQNEKMSNSQLRGPQNRKCKQSADISANLSMKKKERSPSPFQNCHQSLKSLTNKSNHSRTKYQSMSAQVSSQNLHIKQEQSYQIDQNQLSKQLLGQSRSQNKLDVIKEKRKTNNNRSLSKLKSNRSNSVLPTRENKRSMSLIKQQDENLKGQVATIQQDKCYLTSISNQKINRTSSFSDFKEQKKQFHHAMKEGQLQSLKDIDDIKLKDYQYSNNKQQAKQRINVQVANDQQIRKIQQEEEKKQMLMEKIEKKYSKIEQLERKKRHEKIMIQKMLLQQQIKRSKKRSCSNNSNSAQDSKIYINNSMIVTQQKCEQQQIVENNNNNEQQYKNGMQSTNNLNTLVINKENIQLDSAAFKKKNSMFCGDPTQSQQLKNEITIVNEYMNVPQKVQQNQNKSNSSSGFKSIVVLKKARTNNIQCQNQQFEEVSYLKDNIIGDNQGRYSQETQHVQNDCQTVQMRPVFKQKIQKSQQSSNQSSQSNADLSTVLNQVHIYDDNISLLKKQQITPEKLQLDHINLNSINVKQQNNYQQKNCAFLEKRQSISNQSEQQQFTQQQRQKQQVSHYAQKEKITQKKRTISNIEMNYH